MNRLPPNIPPVALLMALLYGAGIFACESQKTQPPAAMPPVDMAAEEITFNAPSPVPARSPQIPALYMKGFDTSSPPASLDGRALTGVGRQTCRTGEALQAIATKSDGSLDVQTFIVHAPILERATPQRVMVSQRGATMAPAILETSPSHTTLTTSHTTLTFSTTREGLLADHALAQAGCFHTGEFSLAGSPHTGPMTGVYNRQTETYTFHFQLSELHAISVLVFLPAQHFIAGRTVETSLAEVFKNPRDATVRVFLEQRQTLTTESGHTQFEWVQLPAPKGILSTRFSGTATRPTAALSLTSLRAPEAWTYGLKEGAALSLEGRASVITDPAGKVTPAPLQIIDKQDK